ncbi:hypothetical protein JTB14_019626 [Gonioctena quinquepunctata]|nr:hypothetical protein JTB14_019626 [Gonioctena quinquepunctata]
MFRYTDDKLLDHITYIINLACTTYFPMAWRRANVIPIPECNNTTDLTHLRPLSLLPKVFEKIMNEQILNFVENCNIITLVQSGYRKFHSTTTALSNISDDIFKLINMTEMVYLVLLARHSTRWTIMSYGINSSSLDSQIMQWIVCAAI